MKTIKIPKNTQVAAFSDPHEHPEQFFNLIEKINPSEKMWIICCGDLEGKGYGEKAFNSMTDKLAEMSNLGYCYTVCGNHEKKYIKKNKNTSNPSTQLIWWKNQPLSLSFEFYNGNRLTAVHAGVLSNMTWEDLETNVEVCYIRDVDEQGMIPLVWKKINGVDTLVKSRVGGESWHLKYDGKHGYIISGHTPNRDGKPKYYNFSCNLDCAVFETGILSAQLFTPEGKLGELITVSGEAFKPKLNESF